MINRINELGNRIGGFIYGLNRRERYFVFTAAAVVFVFLVIRLVVLPLAGNQEQLKKKLAAKKETYRQVLSLKKEYQRVAGRVEGAADSLDNRRKNFRLFSFMDSQAGKAGVKKHITYMKPSTAESPHGGYNLSLVEMKLDGVGLKDLMSYLYKIETSASMVFVKRLSISRQDVEKGGIDALLQVEVVQGKG